MPSKTGNRSFSLLIKPASGDCNLSCDYCFYLEKCGMYPQSGPHRMSEDVLEQVISSYMKTSQKVYAFGWQGGEPTLLGLPFYEKVVQLQQSCGADGAVVSNGLQTNATLIDDELASFFSRYKFLLGVSIDGPQRLHDTYRRNRGGTGSYQDVRRAIGTLQEQGVEFNALVLVTTANVDKPQAVYHHLKELGIHHHQYIPCVEFDEKGNRLPWTITGRQWGAFLSALYALWNPRDIRRVSIPNFDAVLSYLVNSETVVCTMGRNCSQYFVVEHNGDVYPCDFFVRDDLKLGNIMENSWEELVSSKTYKHFGRKKCEWDGDCAGCEYLAYCAGDCLKHRWYGRNNHKNKSWLCEGYREFYAAALPGFSRIASTLKTGE